MRHDQPDNAGGPLARDLTSLSRLLSRALRHEPWRYELELDDEGWTDVAALLAALAEESPTWLGLTEQDLAEMIRTSSKRRHEMVNGRIRALYGHSLLDRLRKEAGEPPELLYHGTSPTAAETIRREGLRPMGRQYVHLSASRDEAVAVGRRKAPTSVILRVLARAAWREDVVFYVGNERVWLADHVPARYIKAEGRDDA